MTTTWTAGVVGLGQPDPGPRPRRERIDLGLGLNLAGVPYTSYEDMILDALLIADHKRRIAEGRTTEADDRIAAILRDRSESGEGR